MIGDGSKWPKPRPTAKAPPRAREPAP
jgi:hypothetical protein